MKDLSELKEKISQFKTGIRIMEVCGTHTMEIFRTGIKDLLPSNIELVSGPGCPVCVTSQSYINHAVDIAKRGAIILTFGDMIRVRGLQESLEDAKADGADVRIIYSPLDCIKVAQNNPNREVVFLGIGFETTTPIISLMIDTASGKNINNLWVLCGMKLIIPALKVLCEDKELNIDGFLLPGHVSAVLGAKPYAFLSEQYNKACAITGFEAYDILLGICEVLKQIETSNPKIENAYKRVVSNTGNIIAYNSIFKVFEPCDSLWRGLGEIPLSGLKLRSQYKSFDASEYYNLKDEDEDLPKGCKCGQVIKGLISPNKCSLFGKPCTPENPIGACMVSSEGSCAAYYRYAR